MWCYAAMAPRAWALPDPVTASAANVLHTRPDLTRDELFQKFLRQGPSLCGLHGYSDIRRAKKKHAAERTDTGRAVRRRASDLVR